MWGWHAKSRWEVGLDALLRAGILVGGVVVVAVGVMVVATVGLIFFFLQSGLFVTTIHESQDYKGRNRAYL